MAVGGHPSARLQEDATCSICLDFFQDPVMIIDCGHNYCRACISQCQGQGSRCPRCRIPFPSENLRPNRDLRNLVEAIQQLSLQPLEKTTRPKPAGGGPKVCEKHQEAAKLFCREDQAFLCLVCRESRAHRAHTALPIEEAAQEYRDQIQTFLKKLAKERDEMQRVNLSNKHNYQQMKGIGDLLNRCERETRRPRHDLRAIIGSLHEKLCVVNTKLNQCAENTPKKPWIKENVTLDAKTAHPRFFVSDDRKSVHWAKTRQDLPYSSKRFEFARCVLGKKGFTSGKHYWIVDVEDGDNWAVGVAQESVDRGGKLDFEPDEGIWAMARYDDQYKALTSPPTLLDLDYDPVEIQVSLNYDAGIVHFYDEDKKPLFTFRSFDFEDEKVFPFFRIGNSSTSLYLL
ncbi:zinc finger protein RFP-like isoform X2 [Anolis sagrei]|uniref:zinc finger protein RFP-like isoform X2 n=1 Tax=Anolis sagrei TaxID=38937 RepID=UPI003522D19F